MKYSGVALLLLLIAQHAAFAQGSLTPPGAPTPTMKTLDQVEPRTPLAGGTTATTIAASGSYYLTGNLSVGAAAAITITAADVTLDLNGFTATGVTGVVVTATGGNVSVRNGAIHGVGLATGIEATGIPRLSVEGLRLVGCASGILAGESLKAERLLLFEHNSGDGIIGGSNSIVRAVEVTGGSSRSPIALGDSSVVEDCAVRRLGPTFSASYTFAIQVGSNSVVRRCIVSSCNVGGNTFFGISTGLASSVVDCNVSGNASSTLCRGISLDYACSVERCLCSRNSGDGIYGYWSCTVRDNTCAGNTGAGIFVPASGTRDRIEANHVTDNGFGLRVDGVGQLIIRNSASNNTTNYAIAANNKVGPIVAAPNSGAISGSTGGAGVGSTDPWANISF